VTTVTESDIKDLKDPITALREDVKGIDNRMMTLEARMTNLETRFTAFEMSQVEIKPKLSGVETSSQKIPDL
jgi:uncharacterized coiled-coil protein SlyX